MIFLFLIHFAFCTKTVKQTRTERCVTVYERWCLPFLHVWRLLRIRNVQRSTVFVKPSRVNHPGNYVALHFAILVSVDVFRHSNCKCKYKRTQIEKTTVFLMFCLFFAYLYANNQQLMSFSQLRYITESF